MEEGHRLHGPKIYMYASPIQCSSHVPPPSDADGAWPLRRTLRRQLMCLIEARLEASRFQLIRKPMCVRHVHVHVHVPVLYDVNTSLH